jgi:hypothetical protein
MTTEPKNEDAICAAVVRFIEQARNENLIEVDRPDKRERGRPAVELLLESPTARFVIEHTRIESYPKQIEDGQRFVALLEPIEATLEGRLPEGKYDLIVNVGAAGNVAHRDADRVRATLEEWVLAVAPSLAAHPDPKEDKPWSVTATPDGVPFDVTLQRWARRGESRILIKRFSPDDLEARRQERISTALQKKLPKLDAAKREFNATESVLIIESDDIALANSSAIGDGLRTALRDHQATPDTIYLIETDRGLAWQLWVMKCKGQMFPEVDDHGPFDLTTTEGVADAD